MIPTLQTRKDGTGDCVRACIAGLLNLPIKQVPDFTGRPDAEADFEIMDPDNPGGTIPSGYPTWYMDLQEWLSGKGFFFLEIQLEKKTWNPLPFEAFAIFIGERASEVPDPENEGKTITARCRHAIVGKCEGGSFLPIFDPLGGNPLEAFVNGDIQAVCFLVPINPSLQVALGKASDSTVRLARQLPWSEIRESILSVNNSALGLPEVALPAGGVDPSAEKSLIITPDMPRTGGGIVLPS